MPGDDISSTSSEDSNLSRGSPTSPSSPTSPNSLRRRKKGKERQEDADRRRSQRRRVRISSEPPIILGSESELPPSLVSPPPAAQTTTEPPPESPTVLPPENSSHIAAAIASSSMLSHTEDVQLHTGASAISWVLGIFVAFLGAFMFPIGLWGGAMIITGGGFFGSRLGVLSAKKMQSFRQLFIAIGRQLENSHILEYIAIRWMHLVLPRDRRRDPRTLHEAIVRSKQQNSGIHTISTLIGLTACGVTFFSMGFILSLVIGVMWFSFTEILGTSYLGFVRFAARLNARNEPSIICIENPLSQRIAIAKRSLAPSTPLCFYLAHIGVLGKYFFRVGAILPILPFSRSLPSSARLAAGAVIADAVHDFAVASGALHNGVMPENVPDVVRARSLKYSVLKASIYSSVLTLITCGIAIGFILGYRVEMNAVTHTTIGMVAFGTFVFWLAVSYFFLARLDNFFSRVFHRLGERIAVIPWIARRRDREALAEMRILFGQTNTDSISISSLGSSAVAAASILAPRAAFAAVDDTTEESEIRQPVTKEYFDQIIRDNLQEVFKDERKTLIYFRINPAFEPVDPNAASMINSYKNRYFVFDSLNEVFVTVVDELPPEAAMYYGSSAAGPSGVRIVDMTDDYDIESGFASPAGSADPHTPPPTPALDEEGEIDSQMTVGDQQSTVDSSSSSFSLTNRQLGLFFQEHTIPFDMFKDSKASVEKELQVVKYFPDYFLSRQQKKRLSSYEISLEDFFVKEGEESKNTSSTEVAKIILFNEGKEEEKRSQDEEDEQEAEELMRIKHGEDLIPNEEACAYNLEPPKKPDKLLDKEMMPTFWNFGLWNMDAIMLLGMITLPFNKFFSH